MDIDIYLDTATQLLGYCTLINITLLLFTTIACSVLNEQISTLHGKMFNLEPADARSAYFNYLANYKLAILLFNLAPYLALKLI
jgi:hypothetical protein